MKKQGFTLIELLAVIVILAIIALIAVPIVIHIINDSKKSSEEETVKLYIDSVKKAIARKQLENNSFNPSICNIENSGNLLCGNVEVIIDMKGQTPVRGTIKIRNNKVKYINLLLNGKYYNKITELVLDNNNNGKPNIGDKYTYQVNDTDIFNFYVLSFNTDDTVNLVMDRHICNDGSVNYKSGNSYCRYKWNTASYDTKEGPTTIMTELYAGTKDWDNVPDMIMNYADSNNSTSIITSNGVTSIIGNPNTKITTIGTKEYPLKARLPKLSEVEEVECSRTEGSCPAWLLGYMQYWSGADNKYIENINTNVDAVWGYWLLNSSDSIEALRISHSGQIGNNNPTFGRYGARPVITVPKSYLE